MTKYCIDCEKPLPNVWPFTIGNDSGLCASCENRRWYYHEMEQEYEQDDADRRAYDA